MIIVQVTDTHITAPGRLIAGGIDTAPALARCVAAVNALDPQPDVVVISGDLVDTGWREDYEHLQRLLSPLRAPVHLLPGNHDKREPLRAVFTDHGGLPAAGPLNHVVDDFPLRLVALDTNVPGAVHGELNQDTLQWLDDRLREGRTRPTMVFLHHPPFSTGIAAMDDSRLRNGDALADILGRHPQVLHVAGGHVHRAIHTRWHGIAASIAPSPSHAIALDLRAGAHPSLRPEPGAFHVHVWQPDPEPFGAVVTHIAYIGS